jgi:PDZ domain-containing secreted protein
MCKTFCCTGISIFIIIIMIVMVIMSKYAVPYIESEYGLKYPYIGVVRIRDEVADSDKGVDRPCMKQINNT